MNTSEKRYWDFLRRKNIPNKICSSKQAQFVEHYDFIVNGEKTEFKGMKAINRGGPPQCDRQPVEWQAVLRVNEETGEITKGRIGWVRGTAVWIVFEEPDGYLYVRRAELEKLVSTVDWRAFTVDGYYSLDFKAFRRQFRDDLFCYVQRACLLQLADTKKLLDTVDSI